MKKSIEILTPENTSEITLRQYQEFIELGTSEMIDGQEVYTTNATEVDILRIFLRLDEKVIGKIKATDVTRISNDIITILVDAKDNPPPLSRIFKYHGKKWGFIPKLDDITFEENSSGGKYLGKWKDMHKAMAVFYRPVTYTKGDKYLIEEYEGFNKYAEALRDMPLSVVMGATFFFYNLLSDLLNATPNYILRTLSPEQLQQIVSFPIGGTITNYTSSVKETLEGLRKYQNIDYTRY